jgi:SsrA-binding protein
VRERKLLLHAKQIEHLQAMSAQKGLTVIPVRLYFKGGRVKLEIALGKGKNVHDRRDDIKARDMARDTARQLADIKR